MPNNLSSVFRAVKRLIKSAQLENAPAEIRKVDLAEMRKREAARKSEKLFEDVARETALKKLRKKSEALKGKKNG